MTRSGRRRLFGLEGRAVARSSEVTARSCRLGTPSAAGYRGSAAGLRPRLRVIVTWILGAGGLRPRLRVLVTWILGAAGLAGYNWWLLVPLKPGLMTSPSELFSNLEVSGQPYAAAMQHADLVSGLLLLTAFAFAGRGPSRGERREWLGMLGFAAAGAAGGSFPEVCADAVNAACRRMEYRFELPASQYIHMIAGVLEFAAITLALLCAERRTRQQSTRPAALYRALAVGALVGYPLLGAAYMLDRLGGLMEVAFFIGFTVMVITYLAERTAAARAAPVTTVFRQRCQV
jgi:Protein of unknown function (DUF998)